MDETTARAHLVIPDLTPLESWGDHSPRNGVVGAPPAGDGAGAEGRRRRIPMRSTCLSSRPCGTRSDGQAPETFPGVETKSAGDLLLDTGRALVPGSEKTVFQAAKPSPTTSATRGGRWPRPRRPRRPSSEFWEGALRRGGYWADVAGDEGSPPRRAQGGRPGAGASRATRPILRSWSSLLSLRRRPRRQQGVAPRDAGSR